MTKTPRYIELFRRALLIRLVEEKIIELLEQHKVSKYFSPMSSKAYLTEDNFINKTNITLNYNDYETKKYEQNFNKNNVYVDKLSIIDVLANLGWLETKKYITN